MGDLVGTPRRLKPTEVFTLLIPKQQHHEERAEERKRARCFSGITDKANRPKRYSVFSSRPSKLRVISTRPWTFSARRDELIDFA